MTDAEEIIFALGHPNVQATHKSTIEITREKELTRNGDCVVAVSADKSASDLSDDFRKAMQNEKAKLLISIEAGNASDQITAWGSRSLTLNDPKDLVLRKSRYICDRTLAICADKAALDLSRKLVGRLMKPAQKVKITLIVQT